MVWSAAARKRLDATFGSRRGAILLQIRTTAHLPQFSRTIFVPPRCTKHIPNPPSHSTASEEELIIFSGFFTFELLCRCQKTVGCNFWQPEGSHFTANSDNGTPAQTKPMFSVRPGCKQHRPNPLSHCTASNEQLVIFPLFLLLVWSVGARKRLDATFGSCRGAILQQIPTTAHMPKLRVFSSFHLDAHSILPTH